MIVKKNNSNGKRGPYVLITAAHNEEAYIERTILSVVDQFVRPLKWVIVNDRSTDRTAEIINHYQAKYDFISLLTVTGDNDRNFGSQVRAINKGYAIIKNIDFEFIGNLDADISFERHYFEQLLNVFLQSPKLGLAGGTIYELHRGIFKPRKFNNPRSVPHAVQLFRRSCYEDVGGYKPLRHGGPDWHAEVTARMKGWDVRTIQGLDVFHHRPTFGAEGMVRGAVRQGLMDYSLGSHPLFEVAKCISRMRTKPYILYGLIRLTAFLWATSKMEKREASEEFFKYIRKEQCARLKELIREVSP